MTHPTPIPAELQHILVSTLDTLGGSVRFKGTRIPIQCLIDTLDDGDGLEEFLDAYPDVSRAAAQGFIHWEQEKSRNLLGLEWATDHARSAG